MDKNEPFNVQIAQWVSKAKGNMEKAAQATAALAVGRVKALTPVKTGYLRSNWTAVLPGQAALTAGEVPPAIVALAEYKLGDRIIITNPVIYARRINYGFVGEDKLGRHYHQAGKHMLEQTIAEMPQLAKTATAWVIAGGDPFDIPGAG